MARVDLGLHCVVLDGGCRCCCCFSSQAWKSQRLQIIRGEAPTLENVCSLLWGVKICWLILGPDSDKQQWYSTLKNSRRPPLLVLLFIPGLEIPTAPNYQRPKRRRYFQPHYIFSWFVCCQHNLISKNVKQNKGYCERVCKSSEDAQALGKPSFLPGFWPFTFYPVLPIYYRERSLERPLKFTDLFGI